MRRIGLFVAVIAPPLIVMLSCAATSMGSRPDAESLVGSENFDSGSATFVNSVETASGFKDARTLRDTMRRYMRNEQAPQGPVPLAEPALGAAPSEDVRVTWIGHSTMLIELDGFVVLADPIWSERCSPFQSVGPRRFHDVAIGLDDLPPIDAVIISHDHYDHLDYETVKRLAWRRIPFYVPLGVGSHLEKWGVRNFVELDWWEEAVISRDDRELRLVATPARHFSGRGLFDRDKTLWASWAVIGERHRAYFGGDTGYFDGFAEIGARLGPFDVTMMPIGAYDRAWADIHMNPEEAVRAHHDMGNTGLLMPIHYGTFRLAAHGWDEPMERFAEAVRASETHAYIPRPGETVFAEESPQSQATWWRPVASGVAADDP